MPYTVNEPIPFAGTPEQAEANRLTHHWSFDGDALACWNCDAKPWHAAASYPCGQEPERREVTYADDETDASTARFAAHAAVLSALPIRGA